MKRLPIIVWVNKNGLWAEIPELKGCYSFGENFEKLDKSLNAAIKLHLKGNEENFKEFTLKYENIYCFRFKIKPEYLLTAYPIKMKVVSKKSGINKNLLYQYRSGIKTCSLKQFQKIIKAINEIGKELLETKFLI